MNWSAAVLLAVMVGSPVLLVVVGALRSNSRYRSAMPPAAAQPRVVAAGTYRQMSLHTWVALAQHDAVAAAVCPLTYLPVSPDPRRKES
jgi:hypothetical protein